MKNFFILLLLLSGFQSYSQLKSKGYFITLDKDMSPVSDQNKAAYFIHVFKTAEGLWQFDHYNFAGPRKATESFKDEDMQIPHGFFAYYNSNGTLDSCGNVYEKKKDGRWTYYDAATGKVLQIKHYDKGAHIRTQQFAVNPKEDSTEEKSKTLFLRVEVESEFPGGINAWVKYLNKKLEYPTRAYDLRVGGMVSILFIVDTEGRVTDPVLAQSVEYSLDEEALRIIRTSPNWTPAMQDGRKVKSYKKQPIVFKFQ